MVYKSKIVTLKSHTEFTDRLQPPPRDEETGVPKPGYHLLDQDGMARVGEPVKFNDVLVNKETPIKMPVAAGIAGVWNSNNLYCFLGFLPLFPAFPLEV